MELSPGTHIHPVFHVSQLHKAVGEHHLPSTLPVNLGADWELMVELETVLGVWTASLGTTGCLEVLIQWKGLSPLEAT